MVRHRIHLKGEGVFTAGSVKVISQYLKIYVNFIVYCIKYISK